MFLSPERNEASTKMELKVNYLNYSLYNPIVVEIHKCSDTMSRQLINIFNYGISTDNNALFKYLVWLMNKFQFT